LDTTFWVAPKSRENGAWRSARVIGPPGWTWVFGLADCEAVAEAAGETANAQESAMAASALADADFLICELSFPARK
jgi:hypothetical protein